jgi:hypothetical protein
MNSVKILHIVSHIVTLNKFTWKRNHLLLGRPVLVTENRRIIKSDQPVMPSQVFVCLATGP